MKKISVIVLCVFFVCGCQKVEEQEEKKFVCDLDCEVADMSGYENFRNEDGVFLDTDFEVAIQKIENKETFVLYLGFAACPWCIEALPILNEEALLANIQIYYVNVRVDEEDLRSEENESYVVLQEYLIDYLDADDNKIYVPAVIVINEGEIVGYHTGTTSEHDAKEREMYDEEIEELHEIYQNLIEKIEM